MANRPKAKIAQRKRSLAVKAPEQASEQPLVLTLASGGGVQLYATNGSAAEIGLSRGMSLADARAMVPDLAFQAADPAADFRGLQGLARWCGRFTPWVNVDGADGLILDITGCAHLFGGEAALLADISGRLAGLGLDCRLAVAATRGAAWALARYGKGEALARYGKGEALARYGRSCDDPATVSDAPFDVMTSVEVLESIGKLPVEGLRLGHEATRTLRRLGLVRIGQVAAIPRIALKRRFSSKDMIGAVTLRLDQALGAVGEPVSPLMPAPQFRTRTAFIEPVQDIAAVAYALEHLLSDLCAMFETKGVGARQLSLAAYRTDGSVSAVHIGTSRPSRDKNHFMLLFREKLQAIEAEYGIDLVMLSADDVAPLARQQLSLASDDVASDTNIPVSQLIDRLSGRLGARQVQRSVPRDSHIPERAAQQAPISVPVLLSAHASWAERRFGPAVRLPVRPFRLFEYPEVLDVMAEVPDGPPVAFRWRRMRVRVARAEGPERIAPEWWQNEPVEDADSVTRDYYRLEDAMGRRFWVYRQGLYRQGLYRQGLYRVSASKVAVTEAVNTAPHVDPRWFMHGLFA